MLTRRQTIFTLGSAAALLLAPKTAFAASLPMVTLHKDPTCDCCTKWGDHLRAAGFPVTVVDTLDLKAIKTRLRVPEALAGCHTAEVGGYVVDGHVPASAIQRLLNEHPAAIGLAVPGMPAGSPGMGGEPEVYEVTLFSESSQQTYARYIGAQLVAP